MDLVYKKYNRIIGFALFGLASLVYILTSEPTTSFWDCGEYISTAYKLQVGHPPGAPIFQLLGRFFSLFAFGNTANVARMVNTMSALSSGLTIAFLFWSITMLAKKLFNGQAMTQPRMIAIFGSGIVGALAYTFTDSFWFSAVEGEVYAMSSLFTAMTFWAILKWEAVSGESHAYRWLMLIAFLIGVSVGVHLLNLLAIPAVVFVFFYKNYNIPGWKGFAIAFGISIILIALILFGIIPEIASLFANTEYFFVNNLGMPFNSGTFFFMLLLISLVVLGLLYTTSDNKKYPKIILVLSAILVVLFMLETSSAGNFFGRLLAAAAIAGLFYFWRNRKALLNGILLAFTFILIGYGSFFMLVIRSNANPPIDENNPENAISLLSYLNREQYGSFPLVYGQYYNAPVVDREDGKPVYKRDDKTGKYIVWDSREGTVPVYDPDYMTIFPRMWNSQEDRYADDYKSWSGITNDPDNKKIPTFSENLRFFFSYQLNFMYFRYFFWNFIGRQNDNQGTYGDILNGNWLSGINFLDKGRLGPQDDIPASMSNKARNTYYFLPFLFGLAGLYYHFRKNAKDGTVVMLIFFMTGIAITVYLNMHSPQPRERDYAYAASFYAYAIWIGLSVLWFFELLSKKLSPKMAALISSGAVFLLVPVILMAQNWDDHDRSGRYTALETAKNYLNSCEPNAILFTNGDNDTFPLWYAQEVEGIRTDVRVCNLSLLNTDWYIDQMARKAYNSDPLPFSLPEALYKNGSHDLTYLLEKENITDYVELKELFNIIRKDDKKLQINTGRGIADYFPTKKFRITVDPAVVLANGTVPPEKAGLITNMEWRYSGNVITKNYLMMLDLIANNNWQRPVYIVSTTGRETYLGMDDYLQLEGFAYRLLPIKQATSKNQVGGVNTSAMYDHIMNKFVFNIKKPGFLISDDIFRMTVTMKNCYATLASALVAENKLDRAVEVCDRIQDLVPDRLVPYNYFNLNIADAYLKAGQTDKGNEILQKMTEIEHDQLAYFFRFPSEKQGHLSMDIQQAMAILNAIGQVAEENNQKTIADNANEVLDTYYNLYVGQPRKP
jgi:tetratricopeptide (TPR) repeat protein/MFS family permease